MSSEKMGHGLPTKKPMLPAGPLEMPILKPTEQEFADLGTFLRSIEACELAAMYGAVKVIPPHGYKARSIYEGHDTFVRCCASQTAEGDSGIYELMLEDAGSMYMSDVERIFAEWAVEGDVPLELSSDARTAEIEFWRNIGFGNSSAVYTAQTVDGTLFEKSTSQWNLNNIRQQRARLEGKVRGAKMSAQGILGLGMGMAGTARGWSVSSDDSYTLQYLHVGAPRTVYVIIPSQRIEFESLASSLRALNADQEQPPSKVDGSRRVSSVSSRACPAYGLK
jgi:jumonji domain-containing protein 2